LHFADFLVFFSFATWLVLTTTQQYQNTVGLKLGPWQPSFVR
jgi:hypothetical protein